jgi:lipopolysaccharide transport system permease protein
MGVDGDESRNQFAVVLFVGMIIHGLFAEVLNQASTLILSNVNYVKKVAFSLENLPIIVMAQHCSVVSSVSSYCWPPLLFLTATCGLAWTLASLGVLLRDVGQTIGIITTVMLFLSPVFFPVTALPEEFRPWFMVNPLTFIIEQAREVLIWGIYRIGADWESTPLLLL